MAEPASLDVTKALSGKHLLFVGGTGFVGKVALSLLLHRYGRALSRVSVVVRRGSSASAESRFFDRLLPGEAFRPLREQLGEEAALAFVRSRVHVLDGDVTEASFGLSEATLASLSGSVDAILNCAGLVSFNPSLEMGLKVNTHGVHNAVGLALRLDVPLVHVSTAFVAGNRSGLVFEDEEIVGFFPRRAELGGRDFSLQRELQDCKEEVGRLRSKAEDAALTAVFRKRAIARLEQEGRDPREEKSLRLAVGRERKLWLTQKLVDAGMERARQWGWPNTYTYTKALGEQVMAGTPELRYAIVRPSIVESALRYPFPGWNEGFTTSAPLAYAGLKGQRALPTGKHTILDIVPVDLVAASLIAITAHTLTTRERRVYHQASGDVNPFHAARSTELVGLYRRRIFRNKSTGSKLWNDVRSRLEPNAVSKRAFQVRSTPLFATGAKLLREALEHVQPTWGAPRVSALLERAQESLSDVEQQATSFSGLVELFLPFIWENHYVFRCDNTRSVYARLLPEDAARLPWDPESIDWRHYFLEVHLPGLEKWVFPALEEERERRTSIHAHRDLLELFDASVRAHRHRVAFRLVEGERTERFTYGETARWVARVASFLARAGVEPGARVLLISENRPEWAFAYFGILKAGATVVPVDSASSAAEAVNIARRAEARAVLLSEDAARNLAGLWKALADAGLQTQVFTLAQAMEGDDSAPDRIAQLPKSVAPDDVASLIFTSGTTGQPKGVMLTHRNFASLVPKLAGSFDFGVGDGLLSVLPLHHTFEFSAGLLTPLSRGAEITYLDELTTDRLGEVFETGRITAMVGVPALWSLLHRKITQEFAARPALVEQALRGLMSAHAELRNRRNVNLGKLLFWPIHRRFGGRIKFLVSGGSALPDEVHQAFHALGFDLAEGYGLTEASPVLTVSAAGNRRQPGTVGKALPGIELRIHEADGEGVGEVWAHGPSVMAGYFGDREATEAALVDGWLRTGDMGRLQSDGQLVLLGRKKDVIIDASGKNVYPDELEDLYAAHPHVKELSIVGLPDESAGEKVACLCVPDFKERAREEVRAELEEHFRRVSADLPFYRLVKVLRFWDTELPRTSSRKVKRPEVLAELQRLERLASSSERARAAPRSTGWLEVLVAEVVGRSASEVTGTSRLVADLGFDSLLLTELSVALETAGVPVREVQDLTGLQTVEDLRRLVASSGSWVRERAAAATPEEPGAGTEREIPVPGPVASLGRSLLSFGQKVLYGGVFDVHVTGQAFIPQNRNVLVIANHTSHLDMGLVKTVLGEQGQRLAALAARDYFFDTPIKRAYFENFTNLIPMDRNGSLRESLRLAGEALHQGYHLLIFPEGTRSVNGVLQDFKPTLGYLALSYGVDILPLFIEGTHAALPKGAMFPKRKPLAVRIGPPLVVSELKRRTKGLARSESYRLVTRIAEQAVRALQAHTVFDLEANAELLPTPAQRRSSGGGSES
jgi:long-chain acyl-CoA synthetase